MLLINTMPHPFVPGRLILGSHINYTYEITCYQICVRTLELHTQGVNV